VKVTASVKTCQAHISIRTFAIMTLVLLVQVNIAKAAPFAYVANADVYMKSGTVSVIDTATNKVTNTVNVGSIPSGVTVKPDSKKVYVTNSSGFPDYKGTVSVIDTTSNKVTATVDIGNSPYGVAVTPDGTMVYVTNTDSNTTTVIDTATDTVKATLNVGIGPWGVAVTPDGTKVYVTNSDSDTTTVIDTATNKII